VGCGELNSAKATADPCGMTNKRTNKKRKQKDQQEGQTKGISIGQAKDRSEAEQSLGYAEAGQGAA
jgi:hypothetical protein